jgi:DNA repair exonuclease SbcCD ATPase subunit
VKELLETKSKQLEKAERECKEAKVQKDKAVNSLQVEVSNLLAEKQKIEDLLENRSTKILELEEMMNHLKDSYQETEKTAKETTKELENAREKFEQLQAELEKFQECSLCLDNPRDCCLQPCGHIFCLNCVEILKAQRKPQCPTCREEILQFSKVYL